LFDAEELLLRDQERMTTKISVITVAFNSATTVFQTLRSVAEQTWGDVEHIVIDGASTDGTLEMIKTHGAHLARVVSEPDGGIYEAMNKGLRAANGDVIAFLNADDYYADATVLQRVVSALEEGNLDAVFGDVAFFSDTAPERVVRRYRSNRFRPERLAWGWMPAHPGLFVKREVFERAGSFSTSYRIAGDFEWIARAFYGQGLRYRYLPNVLVHMRVGGISTGGWANTMLLNREVKRACRENGISTNWLKILSKYPLKMLEFVAS
jgi:glycosyltransferase involved in cell wall biosynthesis